MTMFNVIIRESFGNDWSSEYPLKPLYIVSGNTVEDRMVIFRSPADGLCPIHLCLDFFGLNL